MINDLFVKLEKQGKLKKQETGIVQIEALLKQALEDLAEAEKIHAIAPRATYILAYMALLKAGRALVMMMGYVPDDGAQHKTVVEVTGAVLGTRYNELTLHFEIMRRKRNEMTYEAGGLISASETERAFTDAKSLVGAIIKEARARDPQLELEI